VGFAVEVGNGTPSVIGHSAVLKCGMGNELVQTPAFADPVQSVPCDRGIPSSKKQSTRKNTGSGGEPAGKRKPDPVFALKKHLFNVIWPE
jgi:hypothetical protein